jgi:predicted DNA-binding transcriptional regulator AlpA
MVDRPQIVRDWPRAMPLPLAAEYCGVGASTLSGNGPKPVRIGQKRKVWLREELDAWLDDLAGKGVASSGVSLWDR